MSNVSVRSKSFKVRHSVRINRYMMIKLLLIFGVIGLCVAQKSCPEDATGIYPLCKCKNFEFIFTNDACEKVNRDICPEPAFKTAFGCRCPDPKDFFDDYYWLCRTKLYLPTVRPTQRVVQDTCPVYTRGKWPDCERIPCAKHQTGDYEPYCVSHIQPIIVHEKKCPPGEFGTPPYCSVPCPQYRMRRIKWNNGTSVHPDVILYNGKFNGTNQYNFTCEPIACPKMRGWTGDFMPNCTFTPFCPDEFPGHYPYCNKYAITSSTSATSTIRTTTQVPTTTYAKKTATKKPYEPFGSKADIKSKGYPLPQPILNQRNVPLNYRNFDFRNSLEPLN